MYNFQNVQLLNHIVSFFTSPIWTQGKLGKNVYRNCEKNTWNQHRFAKYLLNNDNHAKKKQKKKQWLNMGV